MNTTPRALSSRLGILALAAILFAPLHLPAAIETWTNLDGQSMQAEFLGRKGDYVSFKKDDGSKYLYPYAKLTDADRQRIDASGTSAIIDENATETPTSAVASQPGSVASAISGSLVSLNGKTFAKAPRTHLDGARYLAFYYSAKWCPPCRAFTPDLVQAYSELKAKHPEFELIFVSSDEDAEAMQDYMSSYNMTWPALRYDQTKTSRAVRRPSHERGIPNLVFMDADGKELSVSYTPEGKYRGPRAVLADIKKHFGS
jgi:nucleoredoxin